MNAKIWARYARSVATMADWKVGKYGDKMMDGDKIFHILMSHDIN